MIAGSIRRRKETVKDIEIVYVSRKEQVQEDLFGPPTDRLCMDRALEDLLARGVIVKRRNQRGSEVWGAANKFAVHVESGIPIDLFATTEDAWFNYVVCRTTPSSICQRRREKGT